MQPCPFDEIEILAFLTTGLLSILLFSNNLCLNIWDSDLLFHLQGLTSGSAELREQAAQGLGELIEVTSEQALKEFVIPITGYV